jgi:hypothetical protein
MKRWMLGSAMVAMAVRMAAAEAGAAIGVPGGAATESSPQAAAQAVSPGSGALAGPARAFSLMSYRLTPYSEPQLVLGFNGDPQDSVISEASPPNEFSSQELGNARIAGSLAYSRQVTARWIKIAPSACPCSYLGSGIGIGPWVKIGRQPLTLRPKTFKQMGLLQTEWVI